MENMKIERNPDEILHIAMFPWLAFGHINPFIHLSNKLISNGVRISFFSSPTTIPRIKNSLIQSHNTQIIPLHLPSIEGLPSGHDNTSKVTNSSEPELLKLALDKTEPQIRTHLANLKPHIVFIDFAQHWLPKIAAEMGIKTINFSVYSAIAYLSTIIKEEPSLRLPTIDELKKPPEGHPRQSLPIKTFEAQEMLYLYKSFCGGPSVIMRCYSGLKGFDAIVLKSCHELEAPYIEYLKTQFGKPVFLAGLALPEPSSDPLEPEFAKWLAQFPSKSVLFCSFGSESFLEDDQIKELALGLELTGLPFILVLNFLEGIDPISKLDQALPSGFVERVNERGMVHTGWVQQQQILGHENVGCYVSHSGFGSLAEALVGDCQIVLLPVKGDQYFNSKLFGLDLKVGVEVNRRDEDGYFGKCDVLEAVRIVMVEVDKEPGKTIRENHKKLRELMMDKMIHDKYVSDLVRDLKALAWNDVD